MKQRLVLVEFFILLTPFLMLFAGCFKKSNGKTHQNFLGFVLHGVFFAVSPAYASFYLRVISGSPRVP